MLQEKSLMRWIVFICAYCSAWSPSTVSTKTRPADEYTTAAAIKLINENVLRLPFDVSTISWTQLVPLIGRGQDISVRWDDPRQGARELASICFNDDEKKQSTVVDQLERYFQCYQSLAQDFNPSFDAFKTRLVTSRGSVGGKCPRWHYDHVPLRWIQSLVGPGCDYVLSEAGVDRSLLNNANSVSEKLNNDMVNPSEASIERGRPGEAVVLLGLQGCDRPAVHKSPKLQPFEGRVLLTIDVEKTER